MDNIKCLIILYNIICMLKYMKKDYLGCNYEKICYEKKIIDNNVNIKISNYEYILKEKNKYIMFFKDKDRYIWVAFFESFFDIKNQNDINYTFKKFKYHIYKNKEWMTANKIFIICPDEYENQISKKILSEGTDNTFETIKYSNMLYDPTEHITFNKHEKIKNYDQKYKKYNLKIPIVLKNDIACKWHGYKLNDIIKITRKDNSICYKIVKDNSEEY